MDNIFDYIVIIFFVVSAIASLLKKKKKALEEDSGDTQTGQQPAQRTPSPQVRSIPSQKPVQAQKLKVLDPFEEFDPFINRKAEESYPQEKKASKFQEFKSEVDNYFEEALKKSMEAEKGIPQAPARRSNERIKAERVPPGRSRTKTKSDTSRSTGKKGSIMDVDRENLHMENKRATDIRERVKNTTELRNLIVISEILQKPKALRR
jgi:hypothetical protein